MSDTAASFDDISLFGGRGFASGDVRALVRGLAGSAAMGVAAVAAVGAAIGLSTVAGVWMVGVALSGNGHLQARAPAGPARLALTDTASFPSASFEAKWARTNTVLPTMARLAARPTEPKIADARKPATPPQNALQPHLQVPHEVAQTPARAPFEVAKLTPPATVVPPLPRAEPRVLKAPKAAAPIAAIPLPRPNPVRLEIAKPPTEKPAPRAADKAAGEAAPKVAALTPAPAAPAVKEGAEAHKKIKAPVLPGPESRTALYDISGHTVYMPDGTQLEAHSGLGSKIDNPRYIKVRMRGPTPPNIYNLTMRERLFHGVRAIRLNPVHESKMFGRDGMLAHTYMLGPSGQSNGCVSFKNYGKFLRAFQNGKVDRLVVVRNLDEAPRNLASLVRAPSGGGRRYAANTVNPINW